MPESPNISVQPSYNRMNDFLDNGVNNIPPQETFSNPFAGQADAAREGKGQPQSQQVDPNSILSGLVQNMDSSLKEDNPWMKSLEFTTPVKTPLAETMRYDKWFTPFDPNIETHYGDQQSAVSKWWNSIVKTGGNVVGGFVQTVATIPTVLDALSKDDMSKVYNNPLTNSINEWMENLETNFPNYETSYGQDHPVLDWIPFLGHSGDKWGGLLKNLGYVVGSLGGAAVESAIVGAATEGAGVPEVLGPQLELTFGRIGRMFASKEGTRTFGEALARGEGVEVAINKAYNSAKNVDRFRHELALTTSALSEGIFFGHQAYKGIKDQLNQEFYKTYGRDPNDEEQKNIQGYAEGGGNAVMLFNTVLSRLVNGKVFGSLFKPVGAAEKDIQKEIAGNVNIGLQKGSLDVFEEMKIAPTGLAKRIPILTKLGPTRMITTQALEGLKFGSQFAMLQGTQDYYKRKFEHSSMDDVDNFWTSVGTGLKQSFTTKEGLENVFMGIMTGPVIHLGKRLMEHARGIENNKGMLTSSMLGIMNSEKLSDLVQNTYGEAVSVQENSKRMDAALKRGDVFEWRNLKFQQLFSFVESGNRAGRFGQRIEQLEMLKDLSKDQFEQLFGVDFNDTNRKNVHEYVDSAIEKSHQIKASLDKIDRVFPNPYKKTDINWAAFNEYKTQLGIDLAAREDYIRRANQLKREMTDLAPTVDNQKIIDMVSDHGIDALTKEYEARVKELDEQVKLTEPNSKERTRVSEERKFLTDKLEVLRSTMHEHNDPSIHINELGELINYHANNGDINGGNQIHPIDLITLLGKAQDSARLISAANATLYHYQRLTSKAGMDNYIGGVLGEYYLQKQRALATIENPNTPAPEAKDPEVVDIDQHGNPKVAETEKPEIAKKESKKQAKKSAKKSEKVAKKAAEVETLKKEVETKKAEKTAPETTNNPETEKQIKDLQDRLSKAEQELETIKQEPEVEEEPPAKYIIPAEESSKPVELNLEEEDALMEAKKQGTLARVIDKVFQAFSPIVRISRIFSRDHSKKGGDNEAQNLHNAVFSGDPKTIYGKMTLKVGDSTSGQKHGEFRKDSQHHNVHYQGYAHDLDIVVDGKVVGKIQPPDRLAFQRGGQYLPLWEMTREEYVANTKNVANGRSNPAESYEEFMTHLNDYRKIYDSIMSEFKGGKKEFSNADVRKLFDVSIWYGHAIHNGETPIKELTYRTEGDAILSIPMTYDPVTKGFTRSLKPTVLNEHELSEVNKEKLWEFIANNIDQLRDINSRYLYVFQMPDGTYKTISPVAARPTQATAEVKAKLFDRIKRTTDNKEQNRQLNIDLRNQLFISDSNNPKGFGTHIFYSIGDNGDVFINFANKKKNVYKAVRVNDAKSSADLATLINRTNDAIQRKSESDRQVRALHVKLSELDFKTSIPEDGKTGISTLENSLQLSTTPSVFADPGIAIRPVGAAEKTEGGSDKPATPPKPKPVKPDKSLPEPEQALINSIKENSSRINGNFRAGIEALIADPANHKGIVETVLSQFVDDPNTGRKIYGDKISEKILNILGGRLVTDRRSLQFAMEHIFKLDKDKARAVAEIYDRVAESYAKREGRTKEEFYRTLTFMNGKDSKVPYTALNQKDDLKWGELRSSVQDYLESVGVMNKDFFNQYNAIDKKVNEYSKNNEKYNEYLKALDEREKLVDSLKLDEPTSLLVSLITRHLGKGHDTVVPKSVFDELISIGFKVGQGRVDTIEENFKKLFKRLGIKDPLKDLSNEVNVEEDNVRSIPDVTVGINGDMKLEDRRRIDNLEHEINDYFKAANKVEDLGGDARTELFDQYLRTPEDQLATPEHDIPNADFTKGIVNDIRKWFMSGNQSILNQGEGSTVHAAVQIAKDGKATIYAVTDPNVSSPVHELAHVWEHYLTGEERDSILEWAGHKEWTRESSEKFARGFEHYLATEEAPNNALKKVFESFKKWLTDIYKGIVGSQIDLQLNDKMKDIYRKMLGEEGMTEARKEVRAEEAAKPKKVRVRKSVKATPTAEEIKAEVPETPVEEVKPELAPVIEDEVDSMYKPVEEDVPSKQLTPEERQVALLELDDLDTRISQNQVKLEKIQAEGDKAKAKEIQAKLDNLTSQYHELHQQVFGENHLTFEDAVAEHLQEGNVPDAEQARIDEATKRINEIKDELGEETVYKQSDTVMYQDKQYQVLEQYESGNGDKLYVITNGKSDLQDIRGSELSPVQAEGKTDGRVGKEMGKPASAENMGLNDVGGGKDFVEGDVVSFGEKDGKITSIRKGNETEGTKGRFATVEFTDGTKAEVQLEALMHREVADDKIYTATGLNYLMDKLSRRFGLKYEIRNDPAGDWKGRFKDGVIYINQAKIDKTTPFHEFGHPFVESLKFDNPELYTALVSEFANLIKEGDETATQIAKDIAKDSYYKGRPSQEKTDEALVRYISDHAAKNINSKGKVVTTGLSTKMSRLIQKFTNWLSKIWMQFGYESGGTALRLIDLKELPKDASLQDVADFMSMTNLHFDLAKNIDMYQGLDMFQKATDEDFTISYDALVKRLKRKVEVLIDTAKNRIPSETLMDEARSAKYILEHENEGESLVKFVDRGMKGLSWSHDEMKRITAELMNGEPKTQKDVVDLNKRLGIVRSLLGMYLTDVRKLFTRLKFDDKINENRISEFESILNKSQIDADNIRDRAVSLTAEWLFPYFEQSSKHIVEKYPEYKLTKEEFKNKIYSADRDIDRMFFLLGSISSSKDPVSAIVRDALFDLHEENHRTNAELNRNILHDYDEFLKTNGLANDRKQISEHFKQNYLRKASVLEKTGINEDGSDKYEYVDRWAFHQPYHYDMWMKEYTDFLTKLGDIPESISEPEKYQAYVDKMIEWQKVNGTEATPAERFRNPAFDKAYQNPLFKTLYDAYEAGNMKLDEDGRLKYGIVPQISNGSNKFSDLSWSKSGLVNVGKRAVGFIKPNAPERDWTDTLENLDGSTYKKIKTAYTRMLEESDLDLALPETVLKFAEASNLHSLLREVEPNVSTLRSLLAGDSKYIPQARRINQVSTGWRTVFDRINGLPANKESRKQLLNKQLLAFIDDVMYGDTEVPDVLKLGRTRIAEGDKSIEGDKQAQAELARAKDLEADGKSMAQILQYTNWQKEDGKWVTFKPTTTLDLNQFGNNMAFLTAINNMAFNFTAGVNNVLIGNIQTLGESLGGKYYKPTDWTHAHGQYVGALYGGDFIRDTMTLKKSKITQLGIKYDAIQGEFRDKYGKRFVGNVAQKYATLDTIFVFTHAGEHQIQLTGMLALMNNTKVKTADGKEMTLFDAHYIDNRGFLKLRDNIVWSKQDEQDFTKRLHGINKMLNGNYSTFDKAYLQRKWYGKFVMVYHKYMYNSFRARWGSKRADYELQDVTSGYYRTFMSKVGKDLLALKTEMGRKNFAKGWNEDERYAAHKTLYEMSMLVGLTAMGIAIGAGSSKSKDTKDKSWGENYLSLMMLRVRQDVGMYSIFGLQNMFNLVKNPSAVVMTLSKYADFFQQLVQDPFAEYKRKTGIFDKGDSVLKAKLLKAIPILRQAIALMSPEEQAKFYTLTKKGFNNN